VQANRRRDRAWGLGASLVLVLSGAVAAEPARRSVYGTAAADASAEVRQVADAVVAARDNRRLPYLIIDKANARVFVFDAAGRLQGSDAALLGLARGDGSLGDIGRRELAAIGPAERITPAGRFLAYLDRDAQGRPILLIDYEASIALHPVVQGTVDERRAERLASPTADDNRISFGCINVPLAFFTDVVRPAFAHTNGYVYILPEAGSWSTLFAAPAHPRR
jgi:hypothetical protein